MELGDRNHWVLQFVEGEQQACLLDGHGLVFALIARGAWDASIEVGERQLAAGASPAAVTINTAYLDEIYGEHLTARQQELRELTAFDAALPALNRRWALDRAPRPRRSREARPPQGLKLVARRPTVAHGPAKR